MCHVTLSVFADNDECFTNNGGCQHTCTNTPGSFICTCNPGFALAANNRDCVGELVAQEPSSCDSAAYLLSGPNLAALLYSSLCTSPDINECVLGTDDCPDLCDNTEGSFTCRCRTGFESVNNGERCEEINECTRGTHNCQQRCTNTPPGAFTCSCTSGYVLNPDQATCRGGLGPDIVTQVIYLLAFR